MLKPLNKLIGGPYKNDQQSISPGASYCFTQKISIKESMIPKKGIQATLVLTNKLNQIVATQEVTFKQKDKRTKVPKKENIQAMGSGLATYSIGYGALVTFLWL